ncbi:hypothetical protein [Streptomyces salinarius]|uniref:hypothetical protein n=1 Tax=Streptomyces salinarius TaxID=2762598 RepID=UPI0013DA482C|nr:hypothetical protein [Streptomyces salinarius]
MSNQHERIPVTDAAPRTVTGGPAPTYWVICRQWPSGEAGSEDGTDMERASGPLAALEALTAWRRTAPADSLAWVVRTTAAFPYDVPALQAEELVSAARAEAETMGPRGARRLSRALACLTS